MFSFYCRNLGGISARRGRQRLLGALTLQLYVLIRVLLWRICRKSRSEMFNSFFLAFVQLLFMYIKSDQGFSVKRDTE